MANLSFKVDVILHGVRVADAQSNEKHPFVGVPMVQVEQDLASLARGVSGVPYFIINGKNGKYGLSGAQDPKTFLQVFEALDGEESQT